MGGLNPYRQPSETISEKRALTQGISRKLLPDFFQISQFRVMMQEILRKLFPGQFHEYLPIKKYFSQNTGHDSVQTEVWYQTKIWTWKNPDSGQNLDSYRWLTTLVMKQRLFRKHFSISGNSFRKFFCAITGIFWISNFIWKLRFREKFPENPWVMAEIVKIAFGKKFRKSSWVTNRFFTG